VGVTAIADTPRSADDLYARVHKALAHAGRNRVSASVRSDAGRAGAHRVGAPLH
jgi:hypothetical protein